MRFMQMTVVDQEALLSRLEHMPQFLHEVFAHLSATDVLLPGPDNSFSPVEHCWHLADLEQDGYAARISRLRRELNPFLPAFDGARVAEERRYKTLSLAAGLQAFRIARFANVAVLRSIGNEEWSRSGTQEGGGVVALCDIPSLMAGHDAAHRQEIHAWLQMRKGNAGPG
jgi:hypothetical protein